MARLLPASVVATMIAVAVGAPPSAAATELPTVTKIEPASGPEAGGQSVWIKGAHFTGATEVKFGSSTPETWFVETEGSIEAVTPPGTGTVDVTVTTPEGTNTTSPADQYSYVARPVVTGIEPHEGLEGGGTVVKITGAHLTRARFVWFGLYNSAKSFTVNSDSSMSAVAPTGKGLVDLRVESPGGTSEISSADRFTYAPPIEKAEYKKWLLSGTLTDNNLGQAITLPEGSAFSGSGELNTETGLGTFGANLSVPAFNAPLKLFGVLPIDLGMTLTQVGPIPGTIANNEAIPGDETLTVPVKLRLGITSMSLLGLTIPTRCATAEPMSLSLADTLTREELLRNGTRAELLPNNGWSFTGAALLPRFACEGGFLGEPFGRWVLTPLLSGPEHPYSLNIKEPLTFTGLESAVTCFAGAETEGSKSSFGLRWEAATDTVAPSSKIVYNVYEATVAGRENYSTPTYTTVPGATSFETPPLSLAGIYFVVRARDPSGHEDSNTIQKEGQNICD